METIYRPIRPSKLTDAQRQAKLQKDSEYEIAVQNLSVAFYQKKRATGVTPQEEQAYQQAKAQLWNDYKNWAIGEGLYEEVTPEQQLVEAEEGLNAQIEEVNVIRTELEKPLLEVKEKATEVM